MKITTRDGKGEVNGWLVPIWNVNDVPLVPQIDQVYLTVIRPGMMKGPHLHYKRRGYFKVIVGSIRLVIRNEFGIYLSTEMDVETDAITVPAGCPTALYNTSLGNLDAYVLNMPSPAWRPDDQDEHDVRDWNYKL